MLSISRVIQLLILPLVLCHSMWNPFARWRQQTNCGYYMPSYIPSYTSSICNYPPRQYQPWTAASYSVMNEAFDNYPYYGQQQMPFKPFMIGQSYHRQPSYFPYYYNNNRIQSGFSKSWQPTTFSPIVQQQQQPTNIAGKLTSQDQQYKIKSYR